MGHPYTATEIRMAGTCICPSCRFATSPELETSWITGADGRLDFRTHGPSLRSCDLCSGKFKDWLVPSSDWDLLPPDRQPMLLCEDCFAQEFTAIGRDPNQ